MPGALLDLLWPREVSWEPKARANKELKSDWPRGDDDGECWRALCSLFLRARTEEALRIAGSMEGRSNCGAFNEDEVSSRAGVDTCGEVNTSRAPGALSGEVAVPLAGVRYEWPTSD